MSVSGHLSQPQFFHGSTHTFQPGDLLTPAGAAKVKYGDKADHAMEIGLAEKHVYYTSDLKEASGLYGHRGHTYQVEPETKSGRPVTTHQPDPNYRDYPDIDAYRTTGRLRVVREVGKEPGE